MASYHPQPSYMDEHEAFAASRSSEHVYVPIDDRSFSTLDKHAETIEMDAKLPLVGSCMMLHCRCFALLFVWTRLTLLFSVFKPLL